MSDEPVNLAVLLVQVKHIVEKQTELTLRLDRLTETLANTYLPRSEYDAERRGDAFRLMELEKDNENQGAFRRQVAAGFVVGFLLLLIPLVGLVANLGG